VQSHCLLVPEDQYQPDYDGMAELWFERVEDLMAARQSPEWKAAATEDEANFIDRHKVAYFVFRGAHRAGQYEVIVDTGNWRTVTFLTETVQAAWGRLRGPKP